MLQSGDGIQGKTFPRPNPGSGSAGCAGADPRPCAPTTINALLRKQSRERSFHALQHNIQCKYGRQRVQAVPSGHVGCDDAYEVAAAGAQDAATF